MSENVRESTKKQFRELGCKLVEIKNIENPYALNMCIQVGSNPTRIGEGPTRTTLSLR